MPPIDPFQIPKAVIPEYSSYRWVRKQLFGNIDRQSMDDAAAAGYRPVPKSRHWNLPASKLWDRETETAEYGGLILMERPDWMTMEAQAQLRKRAYDISGVMPIDAVATFPLPKKTIWERVKHVLGAA